MHVHCTMYKDLTVLYIFGQNLLYELVKTDSITRKTGLKIMLRLKLKDSRFFCANFTQQSFLAIVSCGMTPWCKKMAAKNVCPNGHMCGCGCLHNRARRLAPSQQNNGVRAPVCTAIIGTTRSGLGNRPP